MSVTSTQRRVQYTGDGTNKGFGVPFRALASTDLYVVLTDPVTQTDSDQTVTTHYTVAGDVTQGEATIEFVTAPTSGHIVTIYRKTSIIQPQTIEENTTFSGADIEAALDRLTMAAQENEEDAQRAVTEAITSTATPGTALGSAALTDVFVMKLTAAPTNGLHPFTEQQPIAGSAAFQDLSGGRTGTARSYNNCTDDLTGQFVLGTQGRDNEGGTVYRFQMPGTCA